MDAITTWFAVHFPSPWGTAAGMLAVVLYQYLRVKLPGWLGKSPPAPEPVSPATPAGPAAPFLSNHPAINALLQLLGNRAIPVLADEVKRMIVVPDPEPATPIAATK